MPVSASIIQTLLKKRVAGRPFGISLGAHNSLQDADWQRFWDVSFSFTPHFWEETGGGFLKMRGDFQGKTLFLKKNLLAGKRMTQKTARSGRACLMKTTDAGKRGYFRGNGKKTGGGISARIHSRTLRESPAENAEHAKSPAESVMPDFLRIHLSKTKNTIIT
jgi:hypothetical protein